MPVPPPLGLLAVLQWQAPQPSPSRQAQRACISQPRRAGACVRVGEGHTLHAAMTFRGSHVTRKQQQPSMSSDYVVQCVKKAPIGLCNCLLGVSCTNLFETDYFRAAVQLLS